MVPNEPDALETTTTQAPSTSETANPTNVYRADQHNGGHDHDGTEHDNSGTDHPGNYVAGDHPLG